MPAPPSGSLLDVFEARELRYLAHLSSAKRLKQTTQGRPVHNECELFDTIDAIDAIAGSARAI